MKEKYLYLQTYMHSSKKYLVMTVFVSIVVFLGISLASFCTSDPSWCTYGVHNSTIANYAGFFGAYVASCMVYACGVASWSFIFLLCFVGYAYALQMLGAYKRRIAAGVVVVILSSVLSHLLFSNICDAYYAGGYIGYMISMVLLAYVTKMQCIVITMILWVIFMFIMLNISWQKVGIYMVHAMYSRCSYATCKQIYYVVHTLGWLLFLPIIWIYQASLACIQGEDDDIIVYKAPRAVVFAEQQEIQEVIEDKEMLCVQRIDEPTDENESQVDISLQESVLVTTGYILPNLDIFIGNKEERDNVEVVQHLQERALLLEHKLERFGVAGKVVSIKRGPVVTLFEYEPHIDSKISKITALEDDLALALQALSIRIIAPIPGKPYVGFEVSNTQRKSVSLAHVLRSQMFMHFDGYLPLALGQDTIGNTVIVDLVRMPHLLIAGSTGSGKSVALNTMLVSLLCKLTPDQLRLILIDPKRLEFASYADIAHLLFPIITQPNRAAPVLKWVVQQMEDRYERMAQSGARNIQDYNALMDARGQERLPFIVLIIDELADLMMTAGREIEDLIARIAQMARASGIHLIVATQRPSVDVITGLIKVNFPSRISFRVTSKIDSRTILDCGGADKLLGRGDMLFLDAQDAGLKRLHGAYVSDSEIDQLVAHIRRQRQVQYISLDDIRDLDSADEYKDELYQEVLAYLQEIDEVSISLLQRRFRIGYNRSARIIEMLEMQGFIGPSANGKTRTVIRTQ